MDNQAITNAKKCSRATLVVTLICAFTALAMTISGFLPMISVNDQQYGLFNMISMPGFFEEVDTFQFALAMIVPGIIAFVWAAIPKMWAAVVGIIYALPLIFFASILLDVIQEQFVEQGFLTGGFAFRKYISILYLVLSIVKFILTIRDKKRT